MPPWRGGNIVDARIAGRSKRRRRRLTLSARGVMFETTIAGGAVKAAGNRASRQLFMRKSCSNVLFCWRTGRAWRLNIVGTAAKTFSAHTDSAQRRRLRYGAKGGATMAATSPHHTSHYCSRWTNTIRASTLLRFFCITAAMGLVAVLHAQRCGKYLFTSNNERR